MSQNDTKFYIDGAWVAPAVPKLCDVINPATEEVAGRISMGSHVDVDRAVLAARRAFPSYAATTRAERLALLETIIALYEARADELASAMTAEMGSPITFSISSTATGRRSAKRYRVTPELTWCRSRVPRAPEFLSPRLPPLR
jgi:aldehyde dehydrogenase (NAD+)